MHVSINRKIFFAGSVPVAKIVISYIFEWNYAFEKKLH